MPVIELATQIKSDPETCFDLSRSIDLHLLSTAATEEMAIDGRTSGLIELNEFVTWRAIHFGLTQELTSKVTAFNRPLHFRDEQVKGAFKFFIHDHYFERIENKVIMKDVFKYESPYGLAGKLFNKIVLTKYLTRLLINRNTFVKEIAETNKWKSILKDGQQF